MSKENLGKTLRMSGDLLLKNTSKKLHKEMRDISGLLHSAVLCLHLSMMYHCRKTRKNGFLFSSSVVFRMLLGC